MKPYKKACSLTTAIMTIGSLVGGANAATIFTDRTAWVTALGGAAQTSDDFSADIADGATITFASGVQSMATGEGTSGGGINRVDGGDWDTRIRNASGLSGYSSVTWEFPSNISAFGVDFSSISSSRGIHVSGDFDGSGNQDINLFTHQGSSNGFLGVIGTSSFNSITLSASGTGDNDFFGADDLSFVAVPEPSSAILLGLGATSILIRRRRY